MEHFFKSPLLISAAIVFLVVCLYSGTSRFARGDEHKTKTLCLILTGAALYFAIAGYFFWAGSMLDSTTTSLEGLNQKIFTKEYADKIAALRDDDKRRRFSKVIATDAYAHEGKLILYENNAGKQTLYSPAQDEIERRETTVKLLATLQIMNGTMRNLALTLLDLGAMAVILGLIDGFIARRKAKKSVNLKTEI